MMLNLDPQQRKAVNSSSKRVLIEACPGAGKTEILVQRVAKLLKKGAPPRTILVLAFGHEAAVDLLRRVQAFNPKAAQVQGRTIHSLALSILREYGSRGELKPGWRVLSADQQMKLMARAVDDLEPEHRPVLRPFELVELRGLKVNLGCSLAAAMAQRDVASKGEARIVAALKAYGRRKRTQNVLDFDDLLIRAVNLVWEEKRVRAALKARHHHILVDEGHDLSPLQARLIWLLRPTETEARSLTMVRDRAQAIFRFRGGSPTSGLSCFGKTPPTKIRLITSYRSTQQILEVAAVADPMGRRLISGSALQEGPKPTLRAYPTAKDEAAAIVARLREHHQNGISFSNQAILMRTMRSAAPIENALRAANIPFRRRGGRKDQDPERAMVLALLRFVAWPGQKAIGKDFNVKVLGGRKRSALETRCKGIARDETTSVEKKIEKLIQMSIEEIKDRNGEIAAGRFAAEADRFRKKAKAGRPVDLINELMVEIGTASASYQKDGVDLTTIHGAKGLEWEVVFIPRLKQGIFPTRHAQTDRQMKEEKCLFFVALTRAKVHLHLSLSGPQITGRPAVRGTSVFLKNPGFKGLIELAL
jgi:DNA helicase-2/ATP-dependent DNA helicase PcrA